MLHIITCCHASISSISQIIQILTSFCLAIRPSAFNGNIVLEYLDISFCTFHYVIYDYCIVVLVSVNYQSRYRQFINSLKTYDHDKLFHFVWNGMRKAVPHRIYMWYIIVGKIFQYQPNISYIEELL